MSSASRSRLLDPVERLVAVLTHPARREWAFVGVLVAYVAAWTLYGVLAKASQDLHYDMVEQVAWSRELAWGYAKHPPLAAWLVRIWFTLFPVADWSFYLLAMTVVAVGLWIVWRLAADYLYAESRVVGLALLMLVPFFNFHALKFNANTVLTPMWAATTYCFLRSFERRSAFWGALAGLAAAGAMLGKYWSIILLAGLGIAALLDRRRGAYFRSATPWITAAVGAAAIAPHIAWLIGHDFLPFSYAVAVHAGSFADAAVGALRYLVGAAAYVAIPVSIVATASRPNAAALADILWPETPPRRLAATALWAPLLLPALVMPLFGVELTSLWTMSAWTLLPVVLLSSPLVSISRRAVTGIVAIAVIVPPTMIAAAPFVAIAIHQAGVVPAAAHSRLLADRVAHEWRQASDRPLRLVGGDTDLAFGVAFYSPDRPSVFPEFDRRTAPWADDARVAREGIAVVCFVERRDCVAKAEAQAAKVPASRRTEVEIVRPHLGIAGRPARYVIVTIPPATGKQD